MLEDTILEYKDLKIGDEFSTNQGFIAKVVDLSNYLVGGVKKDLAEDEVLEL